jgi:2-polyprenyl-3-methyl-5-hydroxy-6-metoxy-1,4-benzoquinol methylase
MEQFWNERYGADAYAYGTKPNQFLAENIASLPTGKILFAAEGEGRNAVFAAQNGFHVDAFDTSEKGKIKADLLATEKKVQINYQVGMLNDLGYKSNSFDGLVLIYAHFDDAIRASMHKKLIDLVKPGGTILFEAFNRDQLQYPSGGPKKIEMLFTIEEVKNEFNNCDFSFLTSEIIELSEGEFHQGKGAVIRFIATKQ